MPRPVSHLPKFKRVEAPIRDAILNLRKSIGIIDETLTGRRSEAERKALQC